MCIVVGIDLSTRETGVVVLRGNGEKCPDLVLETIIKYPKLAGIDRIKAICSDVLHLLEVHGPDCIVIEGYSLNMRHASSVIPLVELGGVLRFLMHMDNLKWLAPRATELKKFVTGKGNSPKDQVMMHVLKRWGHESKSNDTADAYGLACMGLAYKGKLPGRTLDQKIVIDKLSMEGN